jgi:hypothetical protein
VCEAEAMPRVCPWCCATLPADTEGCCDPYCREQYERKLMPRRGDEQVQIRRPASPATVRAMAEASRQSLARRRWMKAAAP